MESNYDWLMTFRSLEIGVTWRGATLINFYSLDFLWKVRI
jgi:hypothetical protein